MCTVISSLIFRASGKDFRLIAVHEPSASLDPKMEYELFKRLRELSTEKGKIMLGISSVPPRGILRIPNEAGEPHPVRLEAGVLCPR
jgi:hypothetical protein